MSETKYVLQTKGIYKSFGGNHVLKGIDFDLIKGEVHALLGINGAGKSTLIKIISGALNADSGSVIIEGKELKSLTPLKAQEMGIATIYQETALYPDLSILENLFVGNLIKKRGRIQWKEMEKIATQTFDKMGISLNLYERLGNIGKANMQLVEIAKALTINAKVLIMDEPTSSLSHTETEKLFDIIHQLKSQGTSIIYISHRMEEIFEITDRITVMRDGHIIGTQKTGEVSNAWVTKSMLGKEVNYHLDKKPHNSGEVLLDVKGLSSGKLFRDISFQVRRGEIVVLTGLVGAGRSEVIRAIFGIDTYDSGEVLLKGKALAKNTWDIIKQGVGMLPEDRGNEGVILQMTLYENMILAALPQISSSLGFRNQSKEKDIVNKQMKNLMIQPANLKLKSSGFSGGNQQKIVIGKWLNTDPELLILDEPTTGVDVGAKMEIYRLIEQLSEKGKGILVVSSDIEETSMIADRIIVMRHGRMAGEISGGAAEEEILGVSLGGKEK